MSADHGSRVSIRFGRPSYQCCVARLVIFILLPPMSQLGVCTYESTYEVVSKLINSWPEVPQRTKVVGNFVERLFHAEVCGSVVALRPVELN